MSYNDKHNDANGEGNRDGINENLSWNCGCEGPTDDPAIEALRERQIKNFAVILMMSRGVPMFVAGDEVRRTLPFPCRACRTSRPFLQGGGE